MNKHLSILLVLLLLSSTALAQNGYQFGNWKPSLNDGAAVKPKRAEAGCGALVSLTGSEFSVETAGVLEQPVLYVRERRVCGRITFDAGARQHSQHGAQGPLRRRPDQHRSRRRHRTARDVRRQPAEVARLRVPRRPRHG